MFETRVQREDFDPSAETARLELAPDLGALVSFVGYCRDEGGTLEALELEHYPGMAEAELSSIMAEAAGRWPLVGAIAVHRFGLIRAGERIVLVTAGAKHRADAFAASEFMMDYLKTRAPFWKREKRAGAIVGDWVKPKQDDDSSAERWVQK